jgi:hypothetical protein
MKADPRFVGYIASEHTHDAKIGDLSRRGGELCVHFMSAAERKIRITFGGVALVSSECPEGMIIYSISEMEAEDSLRCFVFVNTDEGSRCRLEVLARDFRVEFEET